MLDMALLTLLILQFLNSFIRNFIIKNGSSLEAKKYFYIYFKICELTYARLQGLSSLI